MSEMTSINWIRISESLDREIPSNEPGSSLGGLIVNYLMAWPMDIHLACGIEDFWIYYLEKEDVASLAPLIVESSLLRIEANNLNLAREGLIFLIHAMELEIDHKALQFAPKYLEKTLANDLYLTIWELAQFMEAADYWSNMLAPGWCTELESDAQSCVKFEEGQGLAT